MKLLKEKFMNKLTRFSLSLMMLALFAAKRIAPEYKVDPRTGNDFTEEDLITLAKFVEECENDGRLSESSLSELSNEHGFTEIQANTLCNNHLSAIKQLGESTPATQTSNSEENKQSYEVQKRSGRSNTRKPLQDADGEHLEDIRIEGITGRAGEIDRAERLYRKRMKKLEKKATQKTGIKGP
jgi:hypothetical protein